MSFAYLASLIPRQPGFPQPGLPGFPRSPWIKMTTLQLFLNSKGLFIAALATDVRFRLCPT